MTHLLPRRLAVALLLAPASACVAEPISPLALVASAPAPDASTVCEMRWRDAARTREVPVRIRMPNGTARVPVVLYSHGLGGSLDAGTDFAKAWASAGIAVIHLQHAGSDGELLRGKTGRQEQIAALRGGMGADQLVARTGDVRFVLDELARLQAGKAAVAGCALSRIDLGRVGMAGHSFGAITTQAVAGQSFSGGRQAVDKRIKAAIAFSPSPPAQGPDAAAFSSIRVPFMSITGTADATPVLNRTQPADRERPFRAMPAGDKYLLVFDGADHAIFNGHRLRRAAAPGDAHVTGVAARASTMFWRATLGGDAPARNWLTTPTGLAGVLAAGDRLETK